MDRFLASLAYGNGMPTLHLTFDQLPSRRQKRVLEKRSQMLEETAWKTILQVAWIQEPIKPMQTREILKTRKFPLTYRQHPWKDASQHSFSYKVANIVTDAQDKFLSQYVRTLLVEWAVYCLEHEALEIGNLNPLFVNYAKDRGWLTKGDRVSAAGYAVATAFLKR